MKFFLGVLLFTILTASAVAAQPSTWNADLNHSSALFTATHLAISHVTGTIAIKSATLKIPEGSNIPVSASAVLDPNTIDTHNDSRDRDLRSGHFFDVSSFPQMTFASTKITPADATHFTIVGNLTMHGVTRPVTLNAQYTGRMTDQRKHDHIAYTASTTIDRTQWGMSYGTFVASSNIDLNLEIEAIKE